MTQSINELEREIEESRARLDLTIDRIQDKLSVSGIVDDMLGTMRRSQYADSFETAIGVIKRNPVPVMLIAAGLGWLIHRMSQEPLRGRALVPYEGPPEEALMRAARERDLERPHVYDAAGPGPLPMSDSMAGGPVDRRL
jgi:hypothetical protein